MKDWSRLRLHSATYSMQHSSLPRFEAIGTSWQIDIYQPVSGSVQTHLLESIRSRIAVFDKNYSRFRDDSLVTRMAREAGNYELPADALPMFSLYHELYSLTEGRFTPLIGSVMESAGYDASYSLHEKEISPPPRWQECIVYEPSGNTLLLKQPVLLDLGALGKGYLIDIVADILLQNGIVSFCIDAGGDMIHRHVQNETLRIGLEHPENTEQVIGVTAISNQSLCGSAGNRRAWGRFHHIINPHTLASTREILATWAIAKTTLLADAMATCLFLVPPEVLTNRYEFEYVVFSADHSIRSSSNFPGELFV